MWPCKTCGEELDEAFDTCWKCGTDRAGGQDPELAISGPLDEVAQTPDSAASRPPDLKLPTYSYFSIPFFLVSAVVGAILQLGETPWPNWPPAPTALEIAMSVAFAVLIGIPGFVVEIQIFYRMWKNPRAGPWELARANLALFVLPREPRHKHPWLVPLYYGLFVAYLFAGLTLPFLFFYWRVFRSG